MEMDNTFKVIKKKFYDYDFIDSIIEKLVFEKNLVDFKIVMDYYFTDFQKEYVTLIFKNCTKVKYSITQKTYEMNDDELNFSHFTITKTEVTKIDNQICIKIFTTNEELEFLKILCTDVVFKSDLIN